MKNFLFGFLLFFSTSAISEVNLIPFQALCSSFKEVESTLNQFEERPVFAGHSFRIVETSVIKVEFIMFHNYKTKTYTIVERHGSDLFCIVSFGNITAFIPPGESI